MDNLEQQLTMHHTPNMDLSEYEAILEQWAKDREKFRAAFEAYFEELVEAFRAFAEALRELWAAFVDAFGQKVEAVRRWLFYERLRRWLIPHWLAGPISERWPGRWLPPFDFAKT